MAGEPKPSVVMDMSSQLMGNQFDPDSGLFRLYCNAAVAKLADATVLETGGPLAHTRPMGVQLPSAAPHLL